MERIGREVSKALGRSGDGSALALSEITAVWPRVVGESVARQAWPLRLGRDGTLHVATSSSTWAFELDRLSPEISGRLRDELGERAPPALRFRAGPVPEPGSSESRSTPASCLSPTPRDAAEATDIAATIDDPELRELVSRAARASLARARSDL